MEIMVPLRKIVMVVCVLCDSEDSIDLFFAYPFARLFWRVIYFTFNIPPPVQYYAYFWKLAKCSSKKN
jgi:hypothetical protein